jgi:hypothetical protein
LGKRADLAQFGDLIAQIRAQNGQIMLSPLFPQRNYPHTQKCRRRARERFQFCASISSHATRRRAACSRALTKATSHERSEKAEPSASKAPSLSMALATTTSVVARSSPSSKDKTGTSPSPPSHSRFHSRSSPSHESRIDSTHPVTLSSVNVTLVRVTPGAHADLRRGAARDVELALMSTRAPPRHVVSLGGLSPTRGGVVAIAKRRSGEREACSRKGFYRERGTTGANIVLGPFFNPAIGYKITESAQIQPAAHF